MLNIGQMIIKGYLASRFIKYYASRALPYAMIAYIGYKLGKRKR